MSVIAALTEWSHDLLLQKGWGLAPLRPLGGDAGFRQYFRIATQPAALAVFSPPESEPNLQFCAIAEHWRNAGLTTPTIFAKDLAQGFLLLEDFGEEPLAKVLAERGPMAVYPEVLASLKELQLVECSCATLYPNYDKAKLLAEMMLMPQWFMGQLLGLPPSVDESQLLDGFFHTLADSALAQSQVIVHRDFHSRNIHVLKDGSFGFIDFQDAVIGPITYDLVSLLKDCYFRIDSTDVKALAVSYREQLPSALAMVSEQDFIRAFDWMGLQRHVKVLGIFARLYLRDGKSGYLNDLPLVVAYVREVLLRYDEFSDVAAWFEARLMPLIVRQPWYRSVEIQP